MLCTGVFPAVEAFLCIAMYVLFVKIVPNFEEPCHYALVQFYVIFV